MKPLVLLLCCAACGMDAAGAGGNGHLGGAGGVGGSGGTGGSDNGCATQVALSIGQDGGHACALTSDGTVWCWGKNNRGQVGNGSYITSGPPFGVSLPTMVPELQGSVTAVSVGERHSCALRNDHTVWCWGWDQNDQLGGSSFPGDSAHPMQVVRWLNGFSSTTPLDGVALVSAGGWSTSAMDGSGAQWGWGWNIGAWNDPNCTTTSCEAFALPTLSNGIRSLSTGFFYTCAVAGDRTLWCWGDINVGRVVTALGAGASRLPVQISSLGGAVEQVATGYGHTCATTNDGTVWCWGWNAFGQLGSPGFAADASPTPIAVTSLGTQVAEVTVGGAHSCARKRDGTVWCWGFNASGQLGNGSASRDPQSTPAQVTALGTHVVSIVAGDLATCAIKDDASLWCWGDNTYGQLGNGAFSSSVVPVRVPLPCPPG